jgi:hypothetical protein
MVKTTLIAPHNKPATRVVPNAGQLKQPMTIATTLPATTRVTTLGSHLVDHRSCCETSNKILSSTSTVKRSLPLHPPTWQLSSKCSPWT